MVTYIISEQRMDGPNGGSFFHKRLTLHSLPKSVTDESDREMWEEFCRSRNITGKIYITKNGEGRQGFTNVLGKKAFLAVL